MTPPPAALLVVADPADDARGDGSYTLPKALLEAGGRSVDLRELRAEDVGGKLRLTVGLGGMDNPWSAPSGFSAVVLDVFVKTDYGGQEDLGDTGFKTPAGSGWQRHYELSGFWTRAWTADKQGRVRVSRALPRVRVEGSSLVLDTGLNSGRYSYWVTSRVYSPLSAGGILLPRVGGDDTELAVSRAGLPPTVDVLLPRDQTRTYADRTLPPVGELRDPRPKALLVLAGAGLAVALLSTLLAWRKR